MLSLCTKVNVLNKKLFHSTTKCLTTILDGTKLSAAIKDEIKQNIDDRVKSGKRRPQLSVVLVGDDPGSVTYVKNKSIAAKYVGIDCELIKLEENTTESKLVNIIKELNNSSNVDAILVQLPLPRQINEGTICQTIDARKDVDGFHVLNAGKMFLDMNDGLMPCTPLAIIEILRRYRIETFGRQVVVCGRSKNVGLPIAIMLQADGKKTKWGMDATVSICNRNSHPLNLARLTLGADIIISAAGVPGLIHSRIIKPGACIIDVGITRITTADGQSKLVGDVDFKDVQDVAGYITPVPGGVGPMTVAMLMRNVLLAAEKISN